MEHGSGEDDFGRICRTRERRDASLLVHVQCLGPGGSAVGGAKDATRVALRREFPQCGDQDDVQIVRVHEDGRDLLRALEADVTPGASGIGGFIHSVAQPVEEGLYVACADVNHVGVRRCHLDGTDGRNGPNRIEDGKPRFSRAGRFPDAARRRAGVEHARLSNGARNGGDPPATEGADVAPNQCGQEMGIEGLRRERRRRERDSAEHQQGWCAHAKVR